MDVLQWFPGCLNMLFIIKAYKIHFLLRKANHKMPIIVCKLLCHGFFRIYTNKFVEWDSLLYYANILPYHFLSFKSRVCAEQNMSPKMILIISQNGLLFRNVIVFHSGSGELRQIMRAHVQIFTLFYWNTSHQYSLREKWTGDNWLKFDINKRMTYRKIYRTIE